MSNMKQNGMKKCNNKGRQLTTKTLVNYVNCEYCEFHFEANEWSLIAELTLIISTNYHFSTIVLCLMTGKN